MHAFDIFTMFCIYTKNIKNSSNNFVICNVDAKALHAMATVVPYGMKLTEKLICWIGGHMRENLPIIICQCITKVLEMPLNRNQSIKNYMYNPPILGKNQK